MINIITYPKAKSNDTSSGGTGGGSYYSGGGSSSSTVVSDPFVSDHFYYDAERDLVVCKNGFATARLISDLQMQINNLQLQIDAIQDSMLPYAQYIDEINNYITIQQNHVEIDGDLHVNGVISHN